MTEDINNVMHHGLATLAATTVVADPQVTAESCDVQSAVSALVNARSNVVYSNAELVTLADRRDNTHFLLIST